MFFGIVPEKFTVPRWIFVRISMIFSLKNNLALVSGGGLYVLLRKYIFILHGVIHIDYSHGRLF